MLSEDDVLAIVKLIDRAYANGGSPVERKRTLADGLAELVSADHWIWVVSRHGDPGTTGPSALSLQHSGLTDAQVAILFSASYDEQDPPPENAPLMEELQGARTGITRRREDLIEDERWRESGHYRRYRAPNGFDEFVYSVHPLSERVFSALGLHRIPGRKPFTVRERRIAHIVLSGVREIHIDGAPADEGLEVPTLTPRLRTVFGLMLKGWKRKQIAKELGLSDNTVAEYQKKIYRHFGVNGQSQLQARFTVGDGGDIPRDGEQHALSYGS